MNDTGQVTEGVVVFNGPTRHPEGSIVRVEEIPAATSELPTWGEVFTDLIGAVDGLPED